MNNYKLILQYDGTRFNGWQKQGNTGNTIQEKLEAVLFELTNEKVEVQGSGRTDAGVHARAQVANFHCEEKLVVKKIKQYCNQYLPEDIRVVDVSKAPERFHSRLNATEKKYRYRILKMDAINVFERKYMYQPDKNIDVAMMREAIPYLIGEHDFKAFCSNKHMKKSTVRTIHSIKINENENEIIIDFYGNGFLYHMVRILVGTLLEVGTGAREAAEINKILTSKNRENAGFTAPAKGLCLMEVKY